MKNLIAFVLFITVLTISIPSMADSKHEHNTEHYEIITSDDARYAAMSLAASQIDIDASAQYIQLGAATARLNDTSGLAITIGYGFGSGSIKLTHTRAYHTNGVALGAIWKF